MEQILELINFLKELYNGKETTNEIVKELSEIHILDLNLKDLWNALSNKWGFLDKSALDIHHISEDYHKRKKKWEQIAEDATKMSDLEFVIKHGSSYLRTVHEAGELDTETIKFEKEHILESPYPIALELDEKFLNYNGQKIYSFRIFDEFPLRINLHLKHEKRFFHELLLFFSFSIENPIEKQLSMEFINNYYRSLIFSYEIIKSLELEKYRESSVRIEDYTGVDPAKIDIYYMVDYYKAIPFVFKVYFIDLISGSVDALLNKLMSQLEQVQEIFDKFKFINQPSNYYSKFEEEIKHYIEQGKKLFLKAEELLYTTRASEERHTAIQEKKSSLTENLLLEIFETEYDHDLKDRINEEDTGFRSLPTIFEKYEKRLEISWKTFNDKALIIMDKSPRFQKRKRMKAGGGTEFRATPSESMMLRSKDKGALLVDIPMGESYDILMDYEQAKMLHDDGKVKDAVEIFENLLKSYENKLDTYSYIYCDVCYRLGQIYEINGYLSEAERVYKAGQKNLVLSNQKSYSFEIALFKIEILRGNYHFLMPKSLKMEKAIKEILDKDFVELNTNYEYIEGTRIQDLDLIYIRDLRRDKEYSKNPLFQEVMQLDLDLLNLQVLKLDLIRRAYYIESLKSLKIVPEKEELSFEQSISESMKDLSNQAGKILKETNKNTFNFGNTNFVLFGFYKTYFEEGQLYDYDIPETFFPYYYTKFLFNMTSYTTRGERKIFERLDRFEFVSLDPESQVEYLIKFCTSDWRGYAFGTKGYARINLYKNMKTLIDHANYLVEKHSLVYFDNTVKTVQSWMKSLVKDFIVSYSKIAERLGDRRG